MPRSTCCCHRAEQAAAGSCRLTNDRSDAQERAALDGMHQGVCLGRTFLWFLTKEVLARERCRTEIRDALHAPSNHDPRIAGGLCGGTRLADGTSARGLAAPPPHRCRDNVSSGLPRIFRRAYTGVSYLFASRKPSAVIFTTRIDAPGPSFTPSSKYTAAVTAPPPSADTTGTGVRRY
jgi:hypothetical protein